MPSIISARISRRVIKILLYFYKNFYFVFPRVNYTVKIEKHINNIVIFK